MIQAKIIHTIIYKYFRGKLPISNYSIAQKSTSSLGIENHKIETKEKYSRNISIKRERTFPRANLFFVYVGRSEKSSQR